MKTRNLLLAASAMTFTGLITSAHAQKADFPFVQVEAGPSWVGSMGGDLNTPGGNVDLDLDFDTGFRLDAGFGYLLRQGGLVSYKSRAVAIDLAPEVEAGLIYNSGTAEVSQTGGIGLEGDLELYQIPVMFNAMFRVHIWNERLTFAFGGGAGVLTTMLDASAPGYSSSDTDVTFGYQALAGLHYDLSNQATVGLGYKFLGTTDQNLGDVETTGPKNHSVALSFTWLF